MADDLTNNENLGNDNETVKATEEAPIIAILKNPGKSFEKMTIKELRELGIQIPGVVGASGMKKEELIDTIYSYMEHIGSPLARPDVKSKKGSGSESAQKATPKELKKKIVIIRDKKIQASEAGDNKKVNAMRRCINRLKKQSRKAAKSK